MNYEFRSVVENAKFTYPADQLMYFLKRPGFIFLFSFSSTLTIKTVVIILNKVIYISLLNLMALYWSAGVTLSSLNHWRGRGAFLGSSDLCSIYDALVKVFTDSWKDVFKIEMRHSEGEWRLKSTDATLPCAHTRTYHVNLFKRQQTLSAAW